jgi:hypothetical protein
VQSLDHVVEVLARIDALEAAAFNQRVHDRSPFGGILAASKVPVLPADH